MAFYYLAGLASNLLTDSAVVFSGDADDANFPHENIATGKPWEMMRFAAAGTDDYIAVDLGSAKSADFCSIHFHNIDSGVTAIKLARDVSGSTAVVTLTKASPSFFGTFGSASDRYWRLTFEGTNSSAIYIGEWVLGAAGTLTRSPDFNWQVGYRMPQQRVASPSGLVLAHNLSEQRLRTLTLNYVSLSDSQLNEHLDDMLDDCAWGEEPLVVVPDSNRNWAIHGRPGADFGTTIHPTTDSTGFWRHSMTIEEDPGPLIVK
jgi:hypothetical protein